MKITGTVRNYTADEASVVGSFFGDHTYNFLLVSDAEVSLPSGTTNIVAVRLESLRRIPSFDGLKVEVDGDYDDSDLLVEAKALWIPECKMIVYGVKRLNVFSASALFFTICAVLFVLPIVLFDVVRNIGPIRDLAYFVPPILAAIAAAFVLAAFSVLWLSILVLMFRVCLPPLFKFLDHVGRAMLEQRPAK